MGPERLVQMGGGQLRTQRHQVGERVHVLVRRADGRAHLAVDRVAVDQHGTPPSTRERPREMRRDERRACSPARRVHRDHARAPIQRGGTDPGRGRRGRERLTIGGPHEEAVGAGADRRTQRADGFTGVDGEERPRARTAPLTSDDWPTTTSGSSWRTASDSCRSSAAVATTRAWPLRSRKCMTSSATSCCSIASTILATSSTSPPLIERISRRRRSEEEPTWAKVSIRHRHD